jgi:hypothetical protein
MNPAKELRDAAFLLRNPFHLPGLKTVIDADVAEPLASLLEWHARSYQAAVLAADRVFVADAEREMFIQRQTNLFALAVARAVVGTEPDGSQ